MGELIITEKENIVAIADAVRNVTNSNESLSLDEITENINLMIGFIPSPSTAEVGQILKVTEIDENGRPTSWETAAVDDKWEKIIEYTVPENVNYAYFTKDMDGNDFELKKALVYVKLVAIQKGDGSYLSAQYNPGVYIDTNRENNGSSHYNPMLRINKPWASEGAYSYGVLYAATLEGAGSIWLEGYSADKGDANGGNKSLVKQPAGVHGLMFPTSEGGTISFKALDVGNSQSIHLGAGSQIIMYGVRK